MDSELRKLERYLAQHPTDYQIWYQYLGLAVREEFFDPLNFQSYATFVTKVAPVPKPQDLELSQEELIAWHDKWTSAQDRAFTLLKNIRQSLGTQLSSTQLAAVFTRLVEEFYVAKIDIRVENLSPKEDEPEITVESFSVWTDETSWVVQKRDVTRNWTTEPRNILDLTPQYILMVEYYYPGSYHNPPDSDITHVCATKRLAELLVKFVTFREDDLAHEAYLNPEIEYPEYDGNYSPRISTDSLVNFAVDSLRRIFRYYREAPKISRFGNDIVIESFTGQDLKDVMVWRFEKNEVDTLDGIIKKDNDSQIFFWVWRAWISNRLRQVMNLLQSEFNDFDF